MTVDIVIRDATARDADAWHRLWNGYLAFYNCELSADITALTWARILDPASPILCRLALIDGEAVGLANCVLHEGTWVSQPICYLEDLFVAANVRGKGVGKALIDDLIELSVSRGWDRLYWHTHASNASARRLYDRYCEANGFVTYRIERPGR